MNETDFARRVVSLEHLAAAHPQRYVLAVLEVMALGFVLLLLALALTLLPALLVLLLMLALALKGGAALLFLFKAGKLLALLFVPLWYMLKSAWQMLFSRLPRPEGREVTAAEVPLLFAQVATLRQHLRGQRIHHILLTGELNAAIVQYPRFGLLGWTENYLLLGMPLLQAVSAEEARAIVAHEYGHLSAQHGRLGGYIYRQRNLWARLDGLSASWQGWLARLVGGLFRWYAPYFNAYTFVLARQNEYAADQLSADLVGAQAAASALLRVNFAAQLEAEVFWPQVQQQVEHLPSPPDALGQRWQTLLRQEMDVPRRLRYLAVAQQQRTDHLDTHPALGERLQALNARLDEVAAAQLEPPLHSAAEDWLGAALPGLLQTFDTAWQTAVTERWEAQHQFLQACRQDLQALLAQDERTLDEDWRVIEHTRTLSPQEDVLPQLEALLQRETGHLQARFLRAALWLERGDEAGIRELEWVMEQDADFILAGCQLAGEFYQTRDVMLAAQYRSRWQARAEYEAQVRQEFASLPADATLDVAELSAEVEAQIREVLRVHGRGIRRAYVLRRRLKIDPARFDYVLLFETRWFTWGNPAPKIIQTLAAQSFPLEMFLVHLNGATYKGLRKAVKRLGVAALFSA